MAITVVNPASAGTNSAGTTLVISKPTNTVVGHVMVAAVAIRPQTEVVTAPAGWTLLRRTDNAAATANSLMTYFKKVQTGEPASYTWTLAATHTGCAGGITPLLRGR